MMIARLNRRVGKGKKKKNVEADKGKEEMMRVSKMRNNSSLKLNKIFF
jgi:hypothetical protein